MKKFILLTTLLSLVFATACDTSTGPFTLSNSFPQNGASAWAANSKLLLRFANGVELDTVTASSVQLRSTSGEVIQHQVTGLGGNVLLDPVSDLEIGESYSLHIGKAVTDTEGQPFAPTSGEEEVITFTVGEPDTTAPKLIRVWTSSGDANAAFDEPLNPLTINDYVDAYSVYSNVISGGVRFLNSATPTTFTFFTSVDPGCGNNYQGVMKVRAGIEDLAGNQSKDYGETAFTVQGYCGGPL